MGQSHVLHVFSQIVSLCSFWGCFLTIFEHCLKPKNRQILVQSAIRTESVCETWKEVAFGAAHRGFEGHADCSARLKTLGEGGCVARSGKT